MIAATLLVASLIGEVSARAPDFATEIVPVLTKAGCNAGACHGAAVGRGEFRLSLLGGDPTFDYESIVHEFEGRRINLVRPEASLLVGKPTGRLDHGGDIPLDLGSPGEARLVAWIAAGAARGKNRKLTEFEVRPGRQVVGQPGARIPLRALARFDGGEVEDVTAWTVFSSSDPSSVEINADSAFATVRRRGQHVVIARFLDRVVSVQVTLPLSDRSVDLARERRVNFIDDQIYKTLTVLRLPVSPSADDATFLRRVHLDLTGTLPSREAVQTFLSDAATDKRERLVDRLLHSDAFADYWALRFARIVRLHSLPNDKESVRVYHRWFLAQIRGGTPLDEVARQLLTATGDSHQVGPANFTRMVGDARGHAELVSHVFLGIRLQCANCHNHPLDRWTQDDYHGLAAVFARLDRGQEVKVTARGAVTNLRTGDPATPRIPGDRYLDPDSNGPAEFARWLTLADNRYFARALVNRFWQAMFGRGLVEPVDDLRDTNPATHPDLLDQLAAGFVEHGFDLRHTLRTIALSETYGRSGVLLPENASDDRFYSRAYPRPLDPEVAVDAISDVTGVAEEYVDEPPGTRAVGLFDPLSPAPSLDILGRCSRVGACEGMTAGGGLPGKLHLLNGELINRKIVDDAGRLHQLIAAGKSDNEILTDFYLRALGRAPTSSEQEHWLGRLSEAGVDQKTEWREDFVWSLLNCREFTTNH